MSKSFNRKHRPAVKRDRRKPDSMKSHKQQRANKRVQIRKEI